ncbi:hypothetical protein EBB45_19965 [Lysinibacillus composti]|uniref:Uncharacterized protein n=1 Tax=Lysinibacillus composti TaxID=720633 RepID=A0A3N9U1I6_9BACI|nr:hypothetical protein EBB45_19965 [Lysinibacillus composti]
MARQKATPFDLPTGEGAPSKSEGVGGAFWRGSRETFPSWVWAKPMIFSFAFELGGAVFAPLLFASQSTSRRILVYRVIPDLFWLARHVIL